MAPDEEDAEVDVDAAVDVGAAAVVDVAGGLEGADALLLELPHAVRPSATAGAISARAGIFVTSKVSS